MPRKAFLADLATLQESCSISAVSKVRRGDDDMFYLTILTPTGPKSFEEVEIACLVTPGMPSKYTTPNSADYTGLSDYPNEHSYQVFLEDDGAPDSVANALESLPPMTGFRVKDATALIARAVINEEDDSLSDLEDEEDDDEDYDLMEDDRSRYLQLKQRVTANDPGQTDYTPSAEYSVFQETEQQRIRIDIAIAKTAGFKVACYGNIFQCSMNLFLCLSIRISKLGLSKDAMENWKVETNDYLVLAICFPNGYQRLESILMSMSRSMRYKIGLSKTYRPSYATLTAVFGDESDQESDWRPTFISKPLEELMNKSFLPILKNRSEGLGWGGAERLFHAQSGHHAGSGLSPDQYRQPDVIHGTFPDVVTYDHYGDPFKPTDQRSFPLVAMQFLLRHFVRCTEFCLVCHRPLEKAIEAIKPYVCNEPLCFYQYMSLGFGPGIEHEILTQPAVIDLLISFASSAARSKRVRQLPIGLGLLVPSIHRIGWKYLEQLIHEPEAGRMAFILPSTRTPEPQDTAPLTDPFEGQIIHANWDTKKIMFLSNKPHNLIAGTWICIVRKVMATDDTKLVHCRIITSYPNCVDVTTPFSASTSLVLQGSESVHIVSYDQNFDQLPSNEAHVSLMLQINLLPAVAEMQSALKDRHRRTLADWSERLSPTAMGILRWIVASNRACIMEVIDNPIVENTTMKLFRFVMGAPVSF
jgi:ubiquitin-conjugating enzyme E2 Q